MRPTDPSEVWELIYNVSISLLVGMAKILTESKRKKKLKWILGQLFISGVAGFLMILLARSIFNLSGDAVGIAAGIAGWGGSSWLQTLSDGKVTNPLTPVIKSDNKDRSDTDSKKEEN